MSTNAQSAGSPATAGKKAVYRQVPRKGSEQPLIWFAAACLLSIGLVMVLSASSVQAYRQYGSSFLFFRKQIMGAALGLAAMFVTSRIDYRILRKAARPMFIAAIVLLAAVLVPGIGVRRGGSSRWIDVGPFAVQPSEFAKLALIVFCAFILEAKKKRIKDFREMAVPVIPAAGMVGLLVMAQPDLGTTIVCVGCVFSVMLLSGARLRHMAGLGGAAAVAFVALALTEGYRRARLFSFLNPWADPLNSGYHIIQGQIALGSGGWFGVGLGASRQKWSYVPNAHTDFLYAILGEELGLAGTLAVAVLFGLLLYLTARVARNAADRFGLLLAGGITGWIGIQTLINMGAVSGLLPITGVPLPLMSFGGSSLVFTMAALGLVLSVAARSSRPGRR